MQRTDTKKDAKRIKSDNFTRSNREKSILLSQYWKNEWFDGTIIISYFDGSNNIFSPTIVSDKQDVKFLKSAFSLHM